MQGEDAEDDEEGEEDGEEEEEVYFAQKLYTTVLSRSELPFPDLPNKSWLQEEDQEEDDEEGEDENEEEEEDEEVKPCSAAL